MSVQQCTLVDVRDPGDHAKWITVTPQTQFVDNDGVSHSAAVTFNYVSDALPSTAKVPRSDAAGNNPTPILYTIRRVLGAGGPGNQTWTDVLLNSSTVNLNTLTISTGGVTVPLAVTSVNHVLPDIHGDVEIDTSSTAALDAEIAARTTAEAAEAAARTAADLLKADKPTTFDNELTKWDEAAKALIPATPGVDTGADFVDPASYQRDVVDRLDAVTAQLEADLVAGDNGLLSILGGVTQWAPGTAYDAGTLRGFGGVRVFSANPPSGQVLAYIPPIGVGDGSDADHDLLLDYRVGFCGAVTGGGAPGTPKFTVTTGADNTFGSPLVTGSLRWAHAQALAAGSGRIIFDKTVFPATGGSPPKIQLKQDFSWFASNTTFDRRGAKVVITGGDGTYTEGGQPGKAVGTVKAYSQTQVVTVSNSDGGTFTLSSGGHTTTALAWNASGATVQAAVRAFGGAYASIVVTGAGPWSIVYADVAFTADGTLLTTTTTFVPAVNVAIPSFKGSFESPSLVNHVASSGDTDVYACVDAGPLLTQAQDLARTPLTSPRWEKVRAWVSGTTYKQSVRLTSPADGKTYTLVRPIGGFTQVTTGVAGTNVKLSNSPSTVDPSTDRFDLDPAGGHWQPIGKSGYTFRVSANAFSAPTGSAAQKANSFMDPTGANGKPPRNIIFVGLDIENNFGGEYGNDASIKDAQVSWWAEGILFIRPFLTNPDRNHDGLLDINGPGTNITFYQPHFKQHYKAVSVAGAAGLATKSINALTLVNPALAENPAGQLAMNSTSTLLLIAKYDSLGHFIDFTAVGSSGEPSVVDQLAQTGAVPVEFEHAQTHPELVSLTAIATFADHYELTVTRGSPAKTHSAAYGATDSTGHPISPLATSKKCFVYTLPHFPPDPATGLFMNADQAVAAGYPVLMDSAGIPWVQTRVTFFQPWWDEIGFRAPMTTDEPALAHDIDSYTSDWGWYFDTTIDATDKDMNLIFPCKPFSLAPNSTGGAKNTQKNSVLVVDNPMFAGTSGGDAVMLAVTSATPGWLRTNGTLLDFTGGGTRSADNPAPPGTADISYSYTAEAASASLRDRIKQAAGRLNLWLYDHDAGIAVPAATTTVLGGVKLAGDIAGPADAPTVPGKVTALTPVATAVDYTAHANEEVSVDTTGANRTITAPASAADKSRLIVKHNIQGGTNKVTVALQSPDVFNKAGGVTSADLLLVGQSYSMQYEAATHIWTIQVSDLPLTSLVTYLASLVQTLSNKRITKRVLDLTSNSATPTVNTDLYDVVNITTQSVNITSMTTNLTGTPNPRDMMVFSFTDAGSAITIAWGSMFESSGAVALPTTTVAGQPLDVGVRWRTTTGKWRCVAVA